MPDANKPVLFIKDGIIFEFHEKEIVTSEVAYFAIEERKRLAGNTKYPLLVEFKRLFGYSPDTHNIDPNVIMANVSALAFFINDSEDNVPESEKRLIENFYEKTPYPVPIKVFFEKQEAIDWLNTVPK